MSADFISNRLTFVSAKLIATLLLALLALPTFAQDAAQQAGTQAAPTSVQAGTPQSQPASVQNSSQSAAEMQQNQTQLKALTPLSQAPVPQHNAHPYSEQDYSRGKRQWPNPFVVYTAREVAPLNVTNSPR